MSFRGHPNPFVRAQPDLPWRPPGDDPRSRVIARKVWQLTDFQTLARAQLQHLERTLILPITDKCTRDIQNLELTTTDLAERLLSLTAARYDKSMWCQRSLREGVTVVAEALWFPCDAYLLHRREMLSTGTEVEVEYYLKLCLSTAGKTVLLVSVHL